MSLLNKILGRPITSSTPRPGGSGAGGAGGKPERPEPQKTLLPTPSILNPFKSNFVDRPTGRPVNRLQGLVGTGGEAQPILRPGAKAPDAAAKAPARPTLVREPRTQAVEAAVTPNLPITDHQTTTSTLTLGEDVQLDRLELKLDIQHTRQRDLVVSLTSPSGKTVTLIDRMGDHTDDILGKFDASAFAGESARGEWTLSVEDKALRGKGSLRGWGLSGSGTVPTGAIDEPRAEPVPLKGPPVVVVLDGGVEANHMDLKGSMWVNEGEIEGDGIDNDGNGFVDDVHGINVARMNGEVDQGSYSDHGTHVAGIIAAADNAKGNTGIAAGKAQVMAIGGLYDGNDIVSNFESAVDYILDQKLRHGVNVRVLNCSFGDEVRDPNELARWDAATKRLLEADILVVAATPNGYGSNMDNVPGDRPSNADSPNVVVVAALDRNLDKLAKFSSYGATTVDLAAPGQDILSTVPKGRWATMSGTSMATPHVSAAAALMFAANPALTATDVAELLLATVEPDVDLEGKVLTGGKLDIQAAVRAAEARIPAAPVEDAPVEDARVVNWA